MRHVRNTCQDKCYKLKKKEKKKREQTSSVPWYHSISVSRLIFLKYSKVRVPVDAATVNNDSQVINTVRSQVITSPVFLSLLRAPVSLVVTQIKALQGINLNPITDILLLNGLCYPVTQQITSLEGVSPYDDTIWGLFNPLILRAPRADSQHGSAEPNILCEVSKGLVGTTE